MELWLQHVGCSSLATGAEVEVVSSGDVFMMCGWGHVARACRAKGALAIHFEYDGAATLFFSWGTRLECCPEGDTLRDAVMGAGYAAAPFSASSSSSDDFWESSDSPEPSNFSGSSDDSYVSPSSRRGRSAAAAAARHRQRYRRAL